MMSSGLRLKFVSFFRSARNLGGRASLRFDFSIEPIAAAFASRDNATASVRLTEWCSHSAASSHDARFLDTSRGRLDGAAPGPIGSLFVLDRPTHRCNCRFHAERAHGVFE